MSAAKGCILVESHMLVDSKASKIGLTVLHKNPLLCLGIAWSLKVAGMRGNDFNDTLFSSATLTLQCVAAMLIWL